MVRGLGVEHQWPGAWGGIQVLGEMSSSIISNVDESSKEQEWATLFYLPVTALWKIWFLVSRETILALFPIREVPWAGSRKLAHTFPTIDLTDFTYPHLGLKWRLRT